MCKQKIFIGIKAANSGYTNKKVFCIRFNINIFSLIFRVTANQQTTTLMFMNLFESTLEYGKSPIRCDLHEKLFCSLQAAFSERAIKNVQN